MMLSCLSCHFQHNTIDSVFQHTFELDEKFCDVIVKRYIEQVGTADKVSVQRDGLLYSYAEVTDIEDKHS